MQDRILVMDGKHQIYDLQITIYDSQGKYVQTKKLHCEPNIVNVNTLPEGNYFLKMNDVSRSFTVEI